MSTEPTFGTFVFRHRSVMDITLFVLQLLVCCLWTYVRSPHTQQWLARVDIFMIASVVVNMLVRAYWKSWITLFGLLLTVHLACITQYYYVVLPEIARMKQAVEVETVASWTQWFSLFIGVDSVKQPKISARELTALNLANATLEARWGWCWNCYYLMGAFLVWHVCVYVLDELRKDSKPKAALKPALKPAVRFVENVSVEEARNNIQTRSSTRKSRPLEPRDIYSTTA